MADILLRAQEFTGPYLSWNGNHRVSVSLRDYLRAALTIGFQSGLDARMAPRTLRAYHLASARGLFGFFHELHGDLCVQSSYHAIESTEKGMLTSFT